jgi:hypothetical protein
MEIKITIEKKYALSLLVLILAIGGFVFAQTAPKPDPGHLFSEIGGLDQNANGVVDSAETLTNLRTGNFKTDIQNKATYTGDFDFSPACPSTNYLVYLTSYPMLGTGAFYVPFIATNVDTDTFTYQLHSVSGNTYKGSINSFGSYSGSVTPGVYTGDVWTHYLVVCL